VTEAEGEAGSWVLVLVHVVVGSVVLAVAPPRQARRASSEWTDSESARTSPAAHFIRTVVSEWRTLSSVEAAERAVYQHVGTGPVRRRR
jgi:hypothetical protein